MTTDIVRDLRPSDVTAWLLCPKRVEYKYTQKEHPSYAMERGSLVHARIEHHLNRGYSFAWETELDDIIQRDTDGEYTIADVPSKGVGRMIGEADAAFTEWKNDVVPTIEQYGDDIEVEVTKYLILPDADDAIMAGTPDLVVPDEKVIIDWKTAKADWKDHKKFGELQPAAYTALNGWSQSTFTFWVFDFAKFKWNAHTVYVTPKQVSAWLNLAEDVAQSMKAGIYPAKPHGQGWTARGWHCSPKYCSAWDVCQAKYLIPDDKADEPSDRMGDWQ